MELERKLLVVLEHPTEIWPRVVPEVVVDRHPQWLPTSDLDLLRASLKDLAQHLGVA